MTSTTPGKRRLLVVSPTFPYPPISGGKQRVFYMLRQLSKTFDLTLLALGEEQEDTAQARAALGFLERLVVVPINQSRPRQLARLAVNGARWLFGNPAEAIVKRSPQLIRTYDRLIKDGAFDAVQVEFSQLIPLLLRPCSATLPILFVAHDVSFISQERKAQTSVGLARWFWSRESRLMRKLETSGWQRSTRVQAMSQVDLHHIMAIVPGARIDVVTNGVDTRALRPAVEALEPTLVFVGWMRHFPNRDAVQWFLTEIWPDIRSRHISVRLAIVGGGLPAALCRIANADDRIDYLGYVEDVAAIVARAWISVVPIRIGSGSRLKILESMALGTPVVTTTIGCEGIELNGGTHALIADAPAEFADQVLGLLAAEHRRRALAAGARQLVESRYDWDLVGVAAAQSVDAAIAARLLPVPPGAD